MMGEHGGRNKKAKKVKPKASSSGGDLAGCGVPTILGLAILVIVVIVFRNELGHLLAGLLQQLLGR